MRLNINKSIQKYLTYVMVLGLFSPALLWSCEEAELLDEELPAIESPKKATPTANKIYYIQNKKSGLHMDIHNKSNSNGANLQQWGNASGTHRQFEVLNTSGGYVRLKGVDSGKSLEVSGGSNANGANVQQWAYQGTTHQQWQIISVGDGYYRIKSRDSGKSMAVAGGSTSNGGNIEQRSWDGSDKFKWFFTEVGSSSGGGGGGGTPGGDTPGEVLGLTSSNWKLNGFDATPSSSATYYDDVLSSLNESFSTYENSNYFYTDGSWAYFKCYRGLGGSANSGNPRVELREMSNGNLASWDGSSGTHSMEFTVRVDQLPKDADNNGGVLCFAQIHGPDENDDGVEVDDLIRVQFIGSSDQSSGAVSLKISGYITEEVQGGSKTISGYALDTEYTFKIQYSGGVVRLYKNGSQVFSQSMDTSTDGNYFKVGNYLQSVQGASFTGSHGIVRIKNLSVSH
ncbi:polysaccharide lyase family 7 protein [Reichenbachiella carrageenanivorans]|uniref:Polysaccharide lyase family 7 protein n=1 Tax=Reichenbachiella carrageenanivorans TaxID=2979869 RepID=A0ABY6D454_9BACT|nr:RICIN domain-containing protein [Reichenbachiella carrageenanivorans]UXX80942.1 polysaccharide lyase family 7 protein [Reichenbachiella carrageenanivorans]